MWDKMKFGLNSGNYFQPGLKFHFTRTYIPYRECNEFFNIIILYIFFFTQQNQFAFLGINFIVSVTLLRSYTLKNQVNDNFCINNSWPNFLFFFFKADQVYIRDLVLNRKIISRSLFYLFVFAICYDDSAIKIKGISNSYVATTNSWKIIIIKKKTMSCPDFYQFL